MCNQGYQSSLAAATLRDLGLEATDLIGGFQAWLQPAFRSSAERGNLCSDGCVDSQDDARAALRIRPE